jgi:hypothetical protein
VYIHVHVCTWCVFCQLFWNLRVSPPAVGTADGQHLTQPHAESVEVHESGIRIEPLWSSQVAIPKQLDTWNILYGNP